MGYALKNRVNLIGNLGSTPEAKTTENGKNLVRFSMATNESYKNSEGEKITETQWHNLVAWGKLADIAERFLEKGALVACEGKLINRSYSGADGITKYVNEIQVTEILFLGNNSNKTS